MNERHSSSQIPRPAIPAPSGFAERKLKPLPETINGLPVYGNLSGRRFTVRCFEEATNPFSQEYKIEIEEAVREGKGYKVVAELLVNPDCLKIDSIRGCDTAETRLFSAEYGKPPHEWRGFDFFSIILDHAKIVAIQNGKQKIELMPANERLVDFYARHGFSVRRAGVFTTMSYNICGELARA